MRQACIRITATILIPYNKKTFGAATFAETHTKEIKDALDAALTGPNGTDAVITRWEAEHTSVEDRE